MKYLLGHHHFSGTDPLQAQAQGFRLAFYLTAAYDLAGLEAFHVVEPVRVFDKITDQAVGRFAATFAFLLILHGQQFADPLADAQPSMPQQQTSGMSVSGLSFSRLFAEDAFGAFVQILAA